MNINISTAVLIISLLAFLNTLILSIAWFGAKSMRTIIGYWCLSRILVSVGVLLIYFRGILPDFFTIVLANTCSLIGQVLIQEGIFRYVGKTGYLRNASLVIIAVQSALFLVFTYIQPDVNSRIVVFTMATALVCWLTIFGLFSRNIALGTPLIFFIGLLFFQSIVMVYRIVISLTQGFYAGFFESGSMQALGLLGQLIFTACIVICFFWLISYRLLQESQQAEEELQTAKNKLETLNIELQFAVRMDGLTQIANRRYFDEQYILLWRDAMRHSKPLSVILADIDLFKTYNDEYGHQVGDACLKKVAKALRDSTKRAADFVARYGGEEFIVILPDTNGDGAEKLAERLRAKVQELNIEHRQSPFGNVTISLGIANTVPTEEQSPENLINAADKVLYDAKKAGRNCVRRTLGL